jgi:nucleotide-binding universal stress UspA family protein
MKTTGMQTTGIPTVVVAVDGSAASNRALVWADAYARATGAGLKLVTCWQTFSGYGPYIAFPDTDNEVLARETLEKARAEVTLPDDRVQTCLAEGPATQVLDRESADAALLVLGSRGHGSIAGALLGSVSSHCMHHSVPSVVVVR